MCQPQCDITWGDLSPDFLYTHRCLRTASGRDHSHDFIELVLILGGDGVFCVDGQLLSVRRGDVLILNPGTRHHGVAGSGRETLEEFYLSFTNIHFRTLDANRFLVPGDSVLVHPEDKTFLRLSRLADSITSEASSCQAGQYAMLKSYLTQMLLILYREYAAPESSSGRYLFDADGKKYVAEQVMEYMEQHYSEKLSLDQVAQTMYLSPFYLSRLFKNETGDTPMNYLIRVRMRRAGELLRSQRHTSIQDVARCVGYEDAYHFSKAFKKHYGMPPSKYRGA